MFQKFTLHAPFPQETAMRFHLPKGRIKLEREEHRIQKHKTQTSKELKGIITLDKE